MRTTTWVVYEALVHGKPTGINAVCEQAEWDAMERVQPGHYTLVRGQITNEGEAERLARGPEPVKVRKSGSATATTPTR